MEEQQTPNTSLKYRASEYDIHDETYATKLKSFETPDEFNKFTDGLMNEKYINRYKLLNAINDYKNTDLYKINPLSTVFEDVAFNFRPYNNCVIS